MVILKNGANKWNNLNNLLILITDFSFSIFLTYDVLLNKEFSWLSHVLFVLLIFTHLFRLIQTVVSSIASKFCFNKPLFWVNNFKLLLFVIFYGNIILALIKL